MDCIQWMQGMGLSKDFRALLVRSLLVRLSFLGYQAVVGMRRDDDSDGNSMIAGTRPQNIDQRPVLEIDVLGKKIVCDPSGALFLPIEDVLIVSDLHLERGAAFARRGMMLPPYDTLITLGLLESVVARHSPRTVVCLGDSFHDRVGAGAMPEVFRSMLSAIMGGRDWIWITGNHDPDAPAGLGGSTRFEIAIGPFLLRHEPTPGSRRGEIAGHLHPRASVYAGRTGAGGPCFVVDGERMVMPAFGAPGGLDVGHRAFEGLFDRDKAMALIVGTTRIFPVPFSKLGGRLSAPSQQRKRQLG
jgi:DNA ligase-associated metallophosphoesterase